MIPANEQYYLHYINESIIKEYSKTQYEFNKNFYKENGGD